MKQRRSHVLGQLGYAATLLAATLPLRTVGAQTYARLDLGWGIEVGGEAERYARVLQLAGLAPLTPWSIQPFTPRQVGELRPRGPNPWSARFTVDPAAGQPIRILAPVARMVENTAFPMQIAGGPTWMGRGITVDGQAGVAGSWGPVYAELAPTAFLAQNSAFDLAPNALTGPARFADARFPRNIDNPQRFGSQRYGRIDPGTSSLVVDKFGVFAALSSAPQRWGPQADFPLVLGPNAGGFPSVQIGSDDPVNLWIAGVHARLVYGFLRQSAFSPVQSGEVNRLGSGVVVTALPRGVPGLEIGASRFLHRPWDGVSFSTLSRPFSGIFNGTGGTGTVNAKRENQVASVFARWALPKARSEVYGEFYKEDYPGGFHNATGSLVEQPDDLASFALGAQRILTQSDSGFLVFRAELVNGLVSHQQRLERGFDAPIPPYRHGSEPQGHTVNGLLLGSPEAYGGSGWRLGLDRFDRQSRQTLVLQRYLRFDWLPTATNAEEPDVIYALRGEMMRFTRYGSIGVVLIPAIDLNRNLVAHHDAFNFTLGLSWRGQ